MNKLFSKVAALSVGLAMAIGVGVALGLKEAKVVRAADDVIDTLTAADTPDGWNSEKKQPTYVETTGITKHTAVYTSQNAITAATGGNLQYRSSSSNSGLVVTTSGGYIKSVSVVWASNTTNGRTLDIYGKGSAYSAASDLYGASAGTSVGSIVKGTSTEYVFTDEYEYFGLRSHSGALYLESITITWTPKSADDPSISINEESQELEVGDTGTLHATTQNVDESYSVVWSSGTPSVVSINSSTGAYEAHAIGAATIRASLQKNSSEVKAAVLTLTVTGIIDVDTAVSMTTALGSGNTSVYKVTVQGIVASVSGDGTKNKNNFVWLSNSSDESAFELYFGYNAVSDWDSFAVVGNKVSAYGNLQNYKGTTMEMSGISVHSVVKTATELEVENFIDEYMHMDSEVEGQCNTYYPIAKEHFNELSADARALFTSDAAYKAAYDRLSAWAAAKGDSFNDTTHVLAMNIASYENNSYGNNTMIIVITIASVSALAFTMLLVFKKKKQK